MMNTLKRFLIACLAGCQVGAQSAYFPASDRPPRAPAFLLPFASSALAPVPESFNRFPVNAAKVLVAELVGGRNAAQWTRQAQFIGWRGVARWRLKTVMSAMERLFDGNPWAQSPGFVFADRAAAPPRKFETSLLHAPLRMQAVPLNSEGRPAPRLERLETEHAFTPSKADIGKVANNGSGPGRIGKVFPNGDFELSFPDGRTKIYKVHSERVVAQEERYFWPADIRDGKAVASGRNFHPALDGFPASIAGLLRELPIRPLAPGALKDGPELTASVSWRSSQDRRELTAVIRWYTRAGDIQAAVVVAPMDAKRYFVQRFSRIRSNSPTPAFIDALNARAKAHGVTLIPQKAGSAIDDEIFLDRFIAATLFKDLMLAPDRDPRDALTVVLKAFRGLPPEEVLAAADALGGMRPAGAFRTKQLALSLALDEFSAAVRRGKSDFSDDTRRLASQLSPETKSFFDSKPDRSSSGENRVLLAAALRLRDIIEQFKSEQKVDRATIAAFENAIESVNRFRPSPNPLTVHDLFVSRCLGPVVAPALLPSWLPRSARILERFPVPDNYSLAAYHLLHQAIHLKLTLTDSENVDLQMIEQQLRFLLPQLDQGLPQPVLDEIELAVTATLLSLRPYMGELSPELSAENRRSIERIRALIREQGARRLLSAIERVRLKEIRVRRPLYQFFISVGDEILEYVSPVAAAHVLLRPWDDRHQDILDGWINGDARPNYLKRASIDAVYEDLARFVQAGLPVAVVNEAPFLRSPPPAVGSAA